MKKDYIINKKSDFWQDKLTESQYSVLLKGGTDAPFDNEYNDYKRKGIYTCAACNNIIFSSKDKYDSGSGWPSFNDIIAPEVLETRPDNKLSVERVETLCSRCGGHLGHLFNDGPKPTGLRYCINSSSLKFLRNAYFGLGCFWGPDAYFGAVKGVYFTAAGYAGGDLKAPSYHNLGNHTEIVRITYDPEIISFTELLDIFWEEHNPYRENFSEQYKSLILFDDEEQENIAYDFLKNKEKNKSSIIYTKLQELNKFYEAEAYHQNYRFQQNQKISKFQERLITNGEKATYSRLLTSLNAFSASHLNREELIKELENSYLFIKDKELIENIKDKLKDMN